MSDLVQDTNASSMYSDAEGRVAAFMRVIGARHICTLDTNSPDRHVMLEPGTLLTCCRAQYHRSRADIKVVKCTTVSLLRHSTSMSMRLNSSKHAQAPCWASPEKKRPIIL